MAATYINGNAFEVNFILWKKDIVSYFWHSYFFHPIEYLKKTESKRFIHALGYAFLLTGSVMLAGKVLQIDNIYFLIAYFPLVIILNVMIHYKKAVKNSEILIGRHYSFTLDEGQMKITDNHSKEEILIDSSEIISIGEKDDMLIIYTNTDEYILPTRVLNDEQIESVLAFK